MLVNVFIIMILISAIVVGGYYYIGKMNKHIYYESNEQDYSIDYLIEYVKESFNEILKTNLYSLNINKTEFEKRMSNKNRLRKALKTCIYGDISSKNYIKHYIKDILLKAYGINDENIDSIIDFKNPGSLDIIDKFEILLYLYKKKYDLRALEMIITEYKLDQPKQTSSNSDLRYVITREDIDRIFKDHYRKLRDFEDKLDIIAQRIYERYKGYSVVDEIRDMQIDGISGGVSGIPSSANIDPSLFESTSYTFDYDSIWIFYKGKTIHLEFLSFGSEAELKRVCKNIYRYNNPGQLSETNGYIVNEMKDGSRVVVARPPFSESWVFFLRKFDSVDKKKTEDLIVDENNDIVIDCIKWLIKGCRVMAITGAQGVGKTTLLMSIVKYINPTFTLRIQEMSFELHLRKLYPTRNIVTFKETNYVSGQEGLDIQKKTDGTVNILGEVASAPVASWMIQMAQVASLFTIFTHHAKTTRDLILSLRNNLLQTGVFSNEKVAEKQVAEVIDFDIHMAKDVSGHRYIERITEIIPLRDDEDYPDKYKDAKNLEEFAVSFGSTVEQYFKRVTDRKNFIARDIVVYEDGRYRVDNKLSDYTMKEIRKQLNSKEQEELDFYISNAWGDSNE